MKLPLTNAHIDLNFCRYSMVNAVPCKNMGDFEICSRWIPPRTFVPVALPIDTTYIEIDHCDFVHKNGATIPTCSAMTAATRMYGNKYLFPTSFDIARSNNSICASTGINNRSIYVYMYICIYVCVYVRVCISILNDIMLLIIMSIRGYAMLCVFAADCLGSFCDFRFVPPICAKKTLGQILGTGKSYLSTTLT